MTMEKPIGSSLLRHLSLRQLQIFETVSRMGSFTRAAEQLCLSQPTVSMQVKKLEDGIGMPLFEQIGKQIYLTDAGKLVRERSLHVLDAVTNLEIEIADIQGLKTGMIRLAVVTTAKYLAPRALGKFCNIYPGVDVALKVTNRERLLERLSQNLDDLYIIGRPPENDDVIFERYLDNPLVVIASRSHPLATQTNIEPGQLTEYPFIMREVGSGTRIATEEYCRQYGIKLKIRMELGSNEAIKQAIDAGLGLSILSRHVLALEGEQGRLVVLDVKGFPIPWQWYVCYLKDKHLSITARTFLEFLKREGENIMHV